MKQLTLLCTGCVLILSGCKDEADAPLGSCEEIIHGWNLGTYTFPRTQAQQDLFFLDERIGFSVGNAGNILKTDDGGQSWKFLNYSYSLETGFNHDAVTDAILQTVFFVNASVGFVGGDGEHDIFEDIHTDAVFLKTSNGGKDWTKTYIDSVREIYDLTFFDEKHGMGLFYVRSPDNSGMRQVRTTDDGGEHWTEIVFPEPRIASFSFVTSPSRIVVETEDFLGFSKLWSTIDQGKTWQQIHLPTEYVYQIYFVNDEIAFMDGNPTEFPMGYYKTTDGGVTWVEMDAPFNNWSAIHFRNAHEGFIINPVYVFIEQGWEGYEMRTSFEGYQTFDGGITWSKSIVGSDCDFEGIQYSPAGDYFFLLDEPSFQRFERP